MVPSGSMVADVASAPFRDIVCAIDSSLTSSRAFQLAGALAHDSHARLLILHVAECLPTAMSPGTRAVSDDESGREWLGTALSNTGTRWLEADAVIAYGSRAHHILAAAHTRHADLIIMDHQDDAKNSGATDYVLRHANCPVLVVDRRASDPVAS
jgi:nucleotide-binding universal stress UspA family protein